MSADEGGVLLVEDDASIAELYKMRLTLDGFTVHHVADGTTAQVIYERARPGVVCVDARLPDGSGTTTVGLLAAQGACVILLTNDQGCYETPPPGVLLALLKARTSPSELSRAITQLMSARSGSRRSS